MGDLFRVRSEWSGTLPGLPYLTTMYFGTQAYVEQDAVDDTAAMWAAMNTCFANDLTVTVSPTVEIIDDVTGTLVGVTGVTPPAGTTGDAAGDPLPTQNQGLGRILTSTITAGRILRGHIYIPGATEDLSTNGAPTGGYQSVAAAAIQDLIDSPNSELRVWSRAHGVSGLATAGSCAPYFAVLRSRRD